MLIAAVIITLIVAMAGTLVAVFSLIRMKRAQGELAQSLLQTNNAIMSISGKQETQDKLIEQQNKFLNDSHVRFNQTLEGMTKTVDQRLDNSSKAVTALQVQMVKVSEAASRMLEIGKDISSLQQILKAPKLRGGVGEQLLGNLLTQMLPQENYQLEYCFKDNVRVDAAIHTAHGIVPIDSKFPIESFQRLAATTDPEERKKKRKDFVKETKHHVDDIASKYIRPAEGTFDFALMYVAAESIYYEMVASEDGSDPLANYALGKKVIPVSPNTFYAYLHTILLGLKGMKLEKHVREIIDHAGHVRHRLNQFRDEFDVVGKHLSNASGAFGRADQKLTHVENDLTQLEHPGDEPVALPKPDDVN